MTYDKLQVLLGRKQHFASQIGTDARGRRVALPTDNPQEVDERRQKLGLPSLARYIALFGGDEVLFSEECAGLAPAASEASLGAGERLPKTSRQASRQRLGAMRPTASQLVGEEETAVWLRLASWARWGAEVDGGGGGGPDAGGGGAGRIRWRSSSRIGCGIRPPALLARGKAVWRGEIAGVGGHDCSSSFSSKRLAAAAK